MATPPGCNNAGPATIVSSHSAKNASHKKMHCKIVLTHRVGGASGEAEQQGDCPDGHHGPLGSVRRRRSSTMMALNSPHGATRRTPCSQSAPRSRRRRRPHFCPRLLSTALSQPGRTSDAHARVRPSRDPSAPSTSKHSNGRLKFGWTGGRRWVSLVRSLLFVCMRECN